MEWYDDQSKHLLPLYYITLGQEDKSLRLFKQLKKQMLVPKNSSSYHGNNVD